MLPYDGPHLHPEVAVQHFLETEICLRQHIRWGIKATRRVEAADFQKTSQFAEHLVQQRFGEKAVKRAMLSFIGLWGKTHYVEWRVPRWL